MKARCVVEFFDLLEDTMRHTGDEFEASEARFKEINGTRYGILAEKVIEKPADRREEPKGSDTRPTGDTERELASRGRRGYRNQ